MHGLGGLDRGNGPARYSPLNDVRDHEQINAKEDGRAPTAGPRFSNAAWLARQAPAGGKIDQTVVPHPPTITATFHSFLNVEKAP